MIIQLFLLLVSPLSSVSFQQPSTYPGEKRGARDPRDFQRHVVYDTVACLNGARDDSKLSQTRQAPHGGFQTFLSTTMTKLTGSLLIVATCLSLSTSSLAADEDIAASSATSSSTVPIIQYCTRHEPGTPTNCVSTANVRQYDLYSPPWTFASSISATEVLARLKGAIQSVYGRDLVDLTETSETSIRAQVTRNLVVPDQLDFIVNPNDRVVVFSAREVSPAPRVSDFGALRQRLEQIRKTAGVFGVMGDAAQDTADGIEKSYYESLKEDQSPLGQLKAFYGLQTGEGFEDVFDD